MDYIYESTPTHETFVKHLFEEQARPRFNRKPVSKPLITEVDPLDPELGRMFHQVTSEYTKRMLGHFALAYGGEVKDTPETTTKDTWELVDQKYPEFTNQVPTLKRIPILYSRNPACQRARQEGLNVWSTELLHELTKLEENE